MCVLSIKVPIRKYLENYLRILLYIYIYIYILGGVFASGPGHRGSILGLSHTRLKKWFLILPF